MVPVVSLTWKQMLGIRKFLFSRPLILQQNSFTNNKELKQKQIISNENENYFCCLRHVVMNKNISVCVSKLSNTNNLFPWQQKEETQHPPSWMCRTVSSYFWVNISKLYILKKKKKTGLLFSVNFTTRASKK